MLYIREVVEPRAALLLPVILAATSCGAKQDTQFRKSVVPVIAQAIGLGAQLALIETNDGAAQDPSIDEAERIVGHYKS